MSWLAFAYYKNRVDTLGGNAADHSAEIRYKIKRYVKRGCQRVDVYYNKQIIFPAGIKAMKKGEKRK